MNLIQIYKLIQVNYKSHKIHFDALIRTVINLFLVLVDMFPGITLITDISETINFITRISTKLGYKLPQLTPDVPTLLLGGTVISNPVLEILSFGLFPTYAIPALFQFVKDFKLLKELFLKIYRISKSPLKIQEILNKSKSEIDSEANTRKVNKEQVSDAEIVK